MTSRSLTKVLFNLNLEPETTNPEPIFMQLLGQNTAELESLFQQMGQPSYRGRQVAQWIYQRGAD
ncbi:MAG: hypothetical protein ABI210_06985, partial [Abditibacteriaceae bacterium]